MSAAIPRVSQRSNRSISGTGSAGAAPASSKPLSHASALTTSRSILLEALEEARRQPTRMLWSVRHAHAGIEQNAIEQRSAFLIDWLIQVVRGSMIPVAQPVLGDLL